MFRLGHVAASSIALLLILPPRHETDSLWSSLIYITYTHACTLTHCWSLSVLYYRIAGNFRGRKLSWIGRKGAFCVMLNWSHNGYGVACLKFCGENFCGWLRNLWRFSPLKVSRYAIHVCIELYVHTCTFHRPVMPVSVNGGFRMPSWYGKWQ